MLAGHAGDVENDAGDVGGKRKKKKNEKKSQNKSATCTSWLPIPCPLHQKRLLSEAGAGVSKQQRTEVLAKLINFYGGGWGRFEEVRVFFGVSKLYARQP